MMTGLLLAVVLVALAFAVLSHRSDARARSVERVADGGFLLAFSGLLAKVAMADEQVSSDEVETVEKMFADMRLTRAENAMCVGNFVLAQRERTGAGELAATLAVSLNPVSRTLLYWLLWRVALADWRVSEGEERLLREIGRALELDAALADRFKSGDFAISLDRKSLEKGGVPPALVQLGLNAAENRGLGMWTR